MMLPMLVRMLFAPMPVPEPFRQEFPFALTVRPGQLRSASEEAAMLIWAAGTLAPAYPQIVCPVAIVAGDGDRVIGPSHPPRLHAVLPRSVLKILPGVGHMPHHAAPDRICDVIELIAAWPAVGTTHETSR
jgi:pimeloyl-ACP methyl ester carboxylesterase